MNNEWPTQQTEDSKSTEKVECFNDKEENFSPEQIDKIMAKVKDVNKEGTAFTGIAIKEKRLYEGGSGSSKRCIEIDDNLVETNKNDIQMLDLNSLSSVLQNGLLGSSFFSRCFYPELSETEHQNLKKNHGNKSKWFKEARRERLSTLFANIVGRDISDLSEAHTARSLGNFGIIYNLDGYTETVPFDECFREDRAQSIKTGKTHTYRALSVMGSRNKNREIAKLTHIILDSLKIPTANLNYKTLVEKIKCKKNKIAVILENFKKDKYHHGVAFNNANEYIEFLEKAGSMEGIMGNPWNNNDGFVILRRVAPRHFEGIIVKSSNMGDDNLQPSKQELQEIIQEVVNLMKKISKESGKEIFLPIYSISGDLLWPKQMSYEEIKKLVEERERKENNKEK